MEKRLNDFSKYYFMLPDVTYSCLSKSSLLKYITLYSRIKPKYYSDVYLGYIDNVDNVKHNNVNNVRIKINIPNDIQVVVKHMHDSKDHRSEANLSISISKLVENNICPHFPLSYGYYLCKNSIFKGPQSRGLYRDSESTTRKTDGKGIILLQEYCGITYSDWLDENQSYYATMTTFLQIFIALHILHTKSKVVHNDIYLINIAMKKIDKPTIFKYTINDKKYYCLAFEYIPIIIDYGQTISGKYRNKYNLDTFMFLNEFFEINDDLTYDNNDYVDKRSQNFLYDILNNMIYFSSASSNDIKTQYKNNKERIYVDKEKSKPLYILENFFHDKFKSNLKPAFNKYNTKIEEY